MSRRIAPRIAIGFGLLLIFADPAQAADQKLGLVTQVEGEGFFLNPLVKKILVTEVTKGSLAEAAGVKAGDQIIPDRKAERRWATRDATCAVYEIEAGRHADLTAQACGWNRGRRSNYQAKNVAQFSGGAARFTSAAANGVRRS
jgi:hypothetical protein